MAELKRVCPQCGHRGIMQHTAGTKLKMAVPVFGMLSILKSAAKGDLPCKCPHCGYEGKLAEFEVAS